MLELDGGVKKPRFFGRGEGGGHADGVRMERTWWMLMLMLMLMRRLMLLLEGEGDGGGGHA